MTAEDLERAVDLVLDGWRKADGLEWSVPAGALEWTCWATADHLAACLVNYSGLLAVRARDWADFSGLVDGDAELPELFHFVAAGGRILATVVRSCAPDARAFHPYGTADPEGFAAMGCVEALIHGDDVATGLGLSLHPPSDLCTRVLGRMFPELAAAEPDADPWAALRHATGRHTLPGRAPVTSWRWHGAPPDG